MTKIFYWDLYEIKTDGSAINGVMSCGRIRKLGLKKQFNVLVENTHDVNNGVRFAVLDKASAKQVKEYVHSVLEDASIDLVAETLPNPVLSKIKVNEESRYEL